MTTTSFDPTGDNFVGGNGNPGLMFVMFPMLIILYFFFAVMFVFEKLYERFSVKRKLFHACYSGVFVLILGMTIYRIVSFRNEINPYFEYEISYLNPFSNHLFFNFWTFIACLCVSGFCSFYIKKRMWRKFVLKLQWKNLIIFHFLWCSAGFALHGWLTG